MLGRTLFHGRLLGVAMPDEPVPPPSPGDAEGETPRRPRDEWISGAPTLASYVDLTARLAGADFRLCEMQANMDELIEANCRLRLELGAMTLQWIIEKSKDD
jgi:hypothetical protein